jgi:uncharacterized protein YndB with AHSA1/START domain
MSDNNTTTVRVSHRFSASPERVFDAWLDPAKACRWLFTIPTGQNVRTEIDARVGGRFTIVDRRDGADVEHIGEYLEIDRPRRLVFNFTVPKYSDKVTRVSIEIVPQGSGCELTLVQDGVLNDYIARTEHGWATMLRALDAALAAETQR